MSAGTLRTWRDDHHDYCRGIVPQHRSERANDVRRCEHGRILIAEALPPGGWGIAWRDLDLVFNPIRWLRARKALRA
jgi:hypothetical protein